MIGIHSSCTNCGAPLSTADAICKPCEREFLQSLADPRKGKHRCPGCGSRFDKPVLDLVPRNAPWYRFQAQKERCPYCKVFLRDRRVQPMTAHQSVVMASLFLVLMATQFFRPPKTVRIAAGCLLVVIYAVEVVWWWRARASVTEEERYAVEKTVA